MNVLAILVKRNLSPSYSLSIPPTAMGEFPESETPFGKWGVGKAECNALHRERNTEKE